VVAGCGRSRAGPQPHRHGWHSPALGISRTPNVIFVGWGTCPPADGEISDHGMPRRQHGDHLILEIVAELIERETRVAATAAPCRAP
jgi:hypothetical protein